MKNSFLFLISLCLFFSLTACPSKNPSPEPSKYMSKEAVIQEYLRLKNSKAIASEALTAEEQLRLNSLVPISNLVDSKSFIVQKPVGAVEIKDVDLRFRDTPVKDQGQYGYCTAYAGIAGMENMLNSGLNLSEWHLWSLYQQPNMGAFFKAISSNYVCDEKNYPTGGKADSQCSILAHVKLTSYSGVAGSAGIQDALNRGLVVDLATNVPAAMMKCPSVISPNSSFQAGAGHAMLIVGIYNDARLDEPILILKNSWNSGCGDNGYFYFPYALCNRAIGGGCWTWSFNSVEDKNSTK
jgi:C1A family cysteine protease